MQFKQIAIGLSVLSYFSLSACAPSTSASGGVVSSPSSPSTGPSPSMTAPSCPAKELQYLVGQPRTVLHTMRFGTEVRIEEPGQPVTADHRGNRTRIIVGIDGKIKSVVCG
jgi:hypothetical protein